MKYLYIEFIDTWAAVCSAQIVDKPEPVRSRIVKIELTDEQQAALKPKKIGKGQNGDVFEGYRLLCLQED